MPERLIVFNPGHFHAALLQKEMYAELSPQVAVFAPLDSDLLDYLARVAQFNSRADNPTHWQLDIHTSSDPLAALLKTHPGSVVLFAGRNRPKIDWVLASLEAGLHVFCDKPWIIRSDDLSKLERALDLADQRHLVAYDIMTERFEVTSELQRLLVRDESIFGRPERVIARSVHHVMKMVAGTPLRRPDWFFDVEDYGEGLADVGTHVVDLVQWTLFADQGIDYRKDIQITGSRRWPLTLSPAQFQQITGKTRHTSLDYFCNNAVKYTVRGVPVELEITWNWEAPAGAGDIYEASFRGTNSRVEVRQEKDPELYVVPANRSVAAAVRERLAPLGIEVEPIGSELHVKIPARLRVGHEAHFAQVARQLFAYLKEPGSLPAWERSNMLAKYFVSTRGVELRKS